MSPGRHVRRVSVTCLERNTMCGATTATTTPTRQDDSARDTTRSATMAATTPTWQDDSARDTMRGVITASARDIMRGEIL